MRILTIGFATLLAFAATSTAALAVCNGSSSTPVSQAQAVAIGLKAIGVGPALSLPGTTVVDCSADIQAGIDAANAHSDANDAATLAAANSHADSAAATAEANANAHSDANDAATLAAANSHADSAAATAETNANAHSDANDVATLDAAKTYADDGDAATLTDANAYSDAGDAATLTSANAYTDLGLGLANARIDDAFKKIDENTEGIAIAIALGGIQVPTGKNFALGASVGFYDDKQAVAAQTAIRLNENLSLNGGIGVGVDNQKVGGRVGIMGAW